MGLLEILLLGVALAADAFSVAISNTLAFDDHATGFSPYAHASFL